MKKQFHYKIIDKEKFDCFKGSDRGSWFALMYIYNNRISPETSSNVNIFAQDNIYNPNSTSASFFEFENIDEIKNFSLDEAQAEMQVGISPSKKERIETYRKNIRVTFTFHLAQTPKNTAQTQHLNKSEFVSWWGLSILHLQA